MAAATTVEQRVKMAAGFLVDAPPGEFHEVLNDVRVLISDDASLQQGIKAAVHEYNLSQFITCKIDAAATTTATDTAAQHTVLVSKYGELADENTFYDPRSKTQFKFDHIRQVASRPEPFITGGGDESSSVDEKWREALDAAVVKYVADHYPSGVSAVYAKDGSLIVAIASNKYNPGNFWNGRWRSEWKIKVGGSATLTGVLRANVHYYEDGNVQLNTDKDHSATVNFTEPVETAEAIVKVIASAEQDYQTALNESYVQLADNTFKSLRRVLPVTRNKLDWNKILNYKLGSALAR